jgi:hypothetical protein
MPHSSRFGLSGDFGSTVPIQSRSLRMSGAIPFDSIREIKEYRNQATALIEKFEP